MRKGWLVLALVASPAAAQSPDTVRVSLADVIRLAAERSAQVEVNRFAEASGVAAVKEEQATLLPHVSADATHGDRTFNTASFGLEFPAEPGQDPLFDPRGEVIGPVTTADFRVHVSQTLFDWAAIERVRRARAELEADRARTDVARERAAATAAARWVDAARAHARVTARAADVALVEDLRNVSQELLGAGAGVRIDVTRAEAQLAALRSELGAAEAASRRADLALLRALNLPLDAPLVIEAGALERPPEEVEPDVTGGLARRPDIVEMDLRIAAAEQDARAVRAERLPTVSVGAGDGITGSTYDHLLNTWEWQVRVSVPVFDGLRRRAREAAAKAEVSALAVRRRELVQQVEFDIRDAQLRIMSAVELVASSETRLTLAEAELDQARERFSAGVAGSADVFNASLRVNEARLAVVDAHAELEAARVTRAIADGSVLELR